MISDDEDIEKITQAFAEIPYMYIADGHHRSAAAALVGDEGVSKILIIRARRSTTTLWLYASQLATSISSITTAW